MNDWLQMLPRGVVVTLALGTALAVIFLIKPPHTPCESQVEVLKKSQTDFLFLDPSKAYKKTTGFEKSLELCKFGNSSGACLDFFAGVKRLHQELVSTASACEQNLIEVPEVKKALWTALELFVRLAWGSVAPKAASEREGWLDSSLLSTYCDLKKFSIENFGQDSWNAFIEEQMRNLPQAEIYSRNEVWQRTILSYPCK